MYCTSCKSIVENQLKNEQAVKKIDIDYMTDSVIVVFDPSLISKQEIKDSLEKSGYKFVRIATLEILVGIEFVSFGFLFANLGLYLTSGTEFPTTLVTELIAIAKSKSIGSNRNISTHKGCGLNQVQVATSLRSSVLDFENIF